VEDGLFFRLAAGDRTAFKEFYEIQKSALKAEGRAYRFWLKDG
jgi:hypothetical protein